MLLAWVFFTGRAARGLGGGQAGADSLGVVVLNRVVDIDAKLQQLGRGCSSHPGVLKLKSKAVSAKDS